MTESMIICNIRRQQKLTGAKKLQWKLFCERLKDNSSETFILIQSFLFPDAFTKQYVAYPDPPTYSESNIYRQKGWWIGAAYRHSKVSMCIRKTGALGDNVNCILFLLQRTRVGNNVSGRNTNAQELTEIWKSLLRMSWSIAGQTACTIMATSWRGCIFLMERSISSRAVIYLAQMFWHVREFAPFYIKICPASSGRATSQHVVRPYLVARRRATWGCFFVRPSRVMSRWVELR